MLVCGSLMQGYALPMAKGHVEINLEKGQCQPISMFLERTPKTCESGHVKKTVFFGFQMKNPKTPIRMGNELKLDESGPINWSKLGKKHGYLAILHPF